MAPITSDDADTEDEDMDEEVEDDYDASSQTK
jgi:hypothetical protein